MEQVFEAFRRADTSKSGTIRRHLLAEVLGSLSPSSWSERNLELLLASVDAGRDGEIRYEEFLAWVFANSSPPVVRRLAGVPQGTPGTAPAGALITYPHTDETPMLVTYSLLPIVRAFTKSTGITFDTPDISVDARILAQFPERLSESQQVNDALSELGRLAKLPDANIVKLPNISASVPQLKAAIAELQSKGYDVPDYPEMPGDEAQREVLARYKKVLGSAVNPVLRQGNSDRRAPPPVKEHARKRPHTMGPWRPDSKTHVASMSEGDFSGSEKTLVMDEACEVRIEFVRADGTAGVLKQKVSLQPGEIVDGSMVSCSKLREFYAREIQEAKRSGVLCSLHLKASMMKVSDPILFGHMVSVFFEDVFAKHAQAFAELRINPNNGLDDLYKKIERLPEDQRRVVQADIATSLKDRPPLAMVDSAKGITNLHVPSDVIIDASMPAAIRSSGQMYGPDGTMMDIKAIIPDRCYAGVFQETIDFCRQNGAFDPVTMGTVQNVGLMAFSAEEYGSHDKTFELPDAGTVRVVSASGTVLMEHPVEKGDIWRMCLTKDLAIQDWVKLAVGRVRSTGIPAVFWLDAKRPHEAALIAKVEEYLALHDTSGLDIRILAPVEACRLSLERARRGEDTISVTGNVLRDYLTDLFPILELGTSAKMLSIVPLHAGGGMYETGAGGTAPKLFRQFLDEGHMHWDSMGEFMALAVAIEDVAAKTQNKKARVVADALNAAVGKLLDAGKTPGPAVGDLDSRGCHFFLALYWAEALAAQTACAELALEFAPVARELKANETNIVEEIRACRGSPVDIGGYYRPDPALCDAAMRPSATLNAALRRL